MDRRKFLASVGAALTAVGRVDARQIQPQPQTHNPMELRQAPGLLPQSFALDETTISNLKTSMQTGSLNSEQITEMYLDRIDEVDWRGPGLRSVIEINPDALAIARTLDAEYKSK